MITEFLHRYTEFQLFAWTIGILGPIAALAVVTRYFVRSNEDKQANDVALFMAEHEARQSGLLIGDTPESPALRAAREKFRPEDEAVDHYATLARNVDEAAIRDAATEHARANGWRAPAGKKVELAAPYGIGAQKWPAMSFSFTPRQLDRVNTARRTAGRPPLTSRGFRAAAAVAANEPRKQPDTTTDWLTYFLLYEVLAADHQGSCHGGLTINPDEPFNGHGGEYAGAGASGQWTTPDPSTASAATAIAAHTPSPSVEGATGYSPGDIVGGYGGGSAPAERPVEPATAGDGYHYSAPDPTPSYTPDPTPSYSPSSYDSSPSPSPDTSSFSSGGGDGS